MPRPTSASKKRNGRFCNCPVCIKSSRRPHGKVVSFTTWRSHQERKLDKTNTYQAPQVHLIVKQPVIQRRTTFSPTPVQELVTVPNKAGPSHIVEVEVMDAMEDVDEMGVMGVGLEVEEQEVQYCDWDEVFGLDPEPGDLYADAMDLDGPQDSLMNGLSPESTQEADSCYSAGTTQETIQSAQPPQEADSSDSDGAQDEHFRFDVPDPPPPARLTFASIGSEDFWKPFLLAISYINLRFHASHRACNLILSVARIVLTKLGHFSATDRPISTLRSAFNSIGLKEPFLTLSMCPHCRRIFPADSPINLKCYNCLVPLFKSKSYLVTDFDGSEETTEDRLNVPRLKCPLYPLSAQLPAFVSRFEEELEKSLQVEHEEGLLRDIRDGQVWKDARAKDGSPFFSPSDSDVLRIGLILHFDGFGGERSRNGASYSSGVLSYSVANLPVHLRYKPENLLVVALSPGPKESTCDELQHLMEAVVDDKIRLYEEGIIVKTIRHPNGRQIEAYCIADGCDHPALCRVFGFADHSHSVVFCTCCKLPREELNSIYGLTESHPVRTGAKHRRLAWIYRAAEPGKEAHQREGLFKTTGTRYYAMSRLKYFDAVRMSAIDPMHNILLGVCKSQWLDSWINRNALREHTARKPRELDQVHSYLDTFEMPSWVGRLPNQVGYPAGGSLSADEYKALVLVCCPIIIPFIWKEWQPLAQVEFDKALTKWEANERDPTTAPYEKPRLRMHPDDACNFLKLSAALKIILGRTVRLTDLVRAECLLKEYLEGYLTIHPLDVKPNHHWVLHIFEQIRDFGPVYGFWTFTSERLNKILKGFKTNNHNGSEIETSFLRAFCKDISLQYTLHSIALSDDEEHDGGLKEVVKLLVGEEKDIRGTVASLNSVSQELEAQAQDTILGFKRPCLGGWVIKTLEMELQTALLEFYSDSHPEANVVAAATRSKQDGRRISPNSSAENAPNSIIQMEFDGQIFVGQVISIIQHRELEISRPTIFIHVRWFRHAQDVDTDAWDPYPEPEVFFWKYNDHLCYGEPGPPPIITYDLIKSQAARATVIARSPRLSDDEDDPIAVPLWVTIGLSRESTAI